MYTIQISPEKDFELGVPCEFQFAAVPIGEILPELSDRTFRITTVQSNVPEPNIVLLECLQVANCQLLTGLLTRDTEDAYNYYLRVALSLCPRVGNQNRISLDGRYTGLTPAGFEGKKFFKFVLTLQGE
jgi:hypothetical protein